MGGITTAITTLQSELLTIVVPIAVISVILWFVANALAPVLPEWAQGMRGHFQKVMLGVMLVGRYATEQNRPAMINYSLLIAGAALLVLALAHNGLQFGAQLINQPPPPVAISQIIIGGLAFFLGIVNSFISVPAQTVLQERAPEHIRARVFSAFYTVSNAILIVPILFAGTMADLLGVVQTVVLIAVAVLVIAFVGLRYQQAHSRVLTPGRAAHTTSGPQEEPEALLAGVTAVEMGGELDFSDKADLEPVAGPFQRAR